MKLNKRQIMSVVRRNAKRIADCGKKQPSITGTIKVKFVIHGPTGLVSNAMVKTTEFRNTAIGRCVRSQAHSFRFPEFRSRAMTVTIPFRLNAKKRAVKKRRGRKRRANSKRTKRKKTFNLNLNDDSIDF